MHNKHLSEKKTAAIIRCFCEDLPAINTAALAGTVLNSAMNHAKVETFKSNLAAMDEDEGMEWSAVFDARTCLVCAALDGKRWLKKDIAQLKTPPAHPNCRCTLIPYNDLVDEENETHIAKDEDGEYFEQKGDFEDYLRDRDEEFQRQWLGTTRYELFKQEKLKVDQMVNPDRGYKRNLKDLEKTLGFEIKPKELITKDYFKISDEVADKYNENEKQAVIDYSEKKIGADINAMYRNGNEDKPEYAELAKQGETIRKAMEKYELPQDTFLYRGCDDYRKLFSGNFPKEGKIYTWNGFVSTTINRYIADRYSKLTAESVVVELETSKGTHGIPMATKKMSKVPSEDKEFWYCLICDRDLVFAIVKTIRV